MFLLSEQTFQHGVLERGGMMTRHRVLINWSLRRKTATSKRGAAKTPSLLGFLSRRFAFLRAPGLASFFGNRGLPFIALLLIVCLAPFPFGAVQLGSWSLLALLVGGVLAAWSVAVLIGRAPPLTAWRKLWWPFAAFALATVWIVLQLLPVTPAEWHHPVWIMGEHALGEPLAGRISIDPQAGIFGLIRLLGYAVIFWLALQYGRDIGRATLGMRVFTVAAGVAAGLGLLLWAAGTREFLWFDKDFVAAQTRYGARLAMPFVNPNHLASFAGMGLICGVGLLAGETRGLWRPETATGEKLRRFFESVVVRRWYLMLSCVVLLAAILLTESRGGALATAAGLLVLAAALMRRRRPRAGAILVGLVALAIVGAAVFAPSLARFADRVAASHVASDQRVDIYTNTVEAIGASPWLGYGYGGFPSLYRFYGSGDVQSVVEAAHSTALETVVELGIPGAMLLFAAVLFPIAWCWTGSGARRRDQHLPAIAAAVGGALVIHSLVDFPLQIPAIAAAFFLLLGLGVAQSVSSKSS